MKKFSCAQVQAECCLCDIRHRHILFNLNFSMEYSCLVLCITNRPLAKMNDASMNVRWESYCYETHRAWCTIDRRQFRPLQDIPSKYTILLWVKVRIWQKIRIEKLIQRWGMGTTNRHTLVQEKRHFQTQSVFQILTLISEVRRSRWRWTRSFSCVPLFCLINNPSALHLFTAIPNNY